LVSSLHVYKTAAPFFGCLVLQRRAVSPATIIAVVALIVAVAALAAPYALAPVSTPSKTGSPQAREFTVFSSENAMDTIPKGLDHYKYSPSQIIVNQGDKVTIHFYNTHDDKNHTFTLPAYNINVKVGPEQNMTFSFTATQAGVFVFSCSFHPITMRGEVVVLPA
jgi:plastocyanin